MNTDNVGYEMRLTEILFMQELGLSLSDINSLSTQRVYEYVIILSEMGKMRKEKMEERRNA